MRGRGAFTERVFKLPLSVAKTLVNEIKILDLSYSLYGSSLSTKCQIYHTKFTLRLSRVILSDNPETQSAGVPVLSQG